jgi:hypothetical protein
MSALIRPGKTLDPSTRRWTGLALVFSSAGFLIVEAIVAAAWDRRPYSYANDYVNFLGSRFVGDFEGYSISSPLWLLMDVGWVLTGVLIAGAAVRLASALPGWRRTVIIILAVALALALLVFAAFPLGPQTIAAGLLPLYLAGAFLSIIAGNGLAILLSAMARVLGLPRPIRIAGVALGLFGLLSIPVTYGWLAIGVAERIPLYSFLAWAAVTGIALLFTRADPSRSIVVQD